MTKNTMKRRGGSFKIEVYSVKWMDENRSHGQQTCKANLLEVVEAHLQASGYTEVSSFDIPRIRVGGQLIKSCRQPKTYIVLMDKVRVTRDAYMRWYGGA